MNRLPLIIGWTLVSLSMETLSQAQTPPVAPKVEHQEVRHGETVPDNYFWLRQKSNPEVVKYLEAENAYTAEMTKGLQPFADSLYQELLSHVKQTDLGVPVRRGDYFYYARTEEGKQYPISCRRKGSMGAPEEVILDLNQIAQGKKFVGLGESVVSDDQNLLAYTLDFTGFRQYTLQVKNLRTGQVLPDRVDRVTSLEWAADNKTLLLTTEDNVTKRPDTMWRHTLGGKTEQVYHEPDELYDLGLIRTRDRKYLVLEIESKDTNESRYVASAHPAQEPKVFLPRAKKHRYYLEHRGDLFYIRTNRDAQGTELKDFEIVTAPEGDIAQKNWKTFVPHTPGALIEQLDLFRDFAVVETMTEAVNHLRVLNFKTNEWHEIVFSEPVYAAFPGSTPEFNSDTYRYNYQSLITPPSVYDFFVTEERSALLKRQEVPGGYDPANYVSERLWATARDGIRVPISIVYKKGLVRDGKAPLFLYAYGSYGFSTPAAFNASRLALLDRGMSFAIAHIRGGSERGENWREDGMLMKKKNTFQDFIDSAQYLVDQKWTSSDRLVIEGGSAGGLLMGAVVNMRPDLFKAVHAAVPFVDVMKQAGYDYMKTYSPYDNLEKRAYPAMLVTTSFNDSQVMYWEPAKYVARLRTVKDDSTPLLLKIKMDPAGHGGASGRYDRLKDTAFEYAWMLSQVGITK
jgi:oligopeptidase B